MSQIAHIESLLAEMVEPFEAHVKNLEDDGDERAAAARRILEQAEEIVQSRYVRLRAERSEG